MAWQVKFGEMRLLNKIYVAIDGNDIGRIIEKYLLCENLEELSNFSKDMNGAILNISRFIENNNGMLIMSGGDNILACLPEGIYPELKRYISRYNENIAFKFSVGVSKYPLGSYLALKYAKANKVYSIKFDDGKFSLI